MSQEFDPRTLGNLATLHPQAQAVARDFMRRAMLALVMLNLYPRIISATRSYAEQNALYAQGRTKPGRIVTNARSGFSNHNFGIAFDVGIFDARGRYIDEVLPEKEVSHFYRMLAPIGAAVGETWGGDWKSFPDEPHYELHPAWAQGMSESDMLAELRHRHENGRDVFA